MLLKHLGVPPGAWQLFWYGRLTEVPSARRTPYIRAYFAKVVLEEGVIIDRPAGVIHLDLPISDIPAIPLGTVFDDRLIIPSLPLHDDAEWTDIFVDFTRQNLRIVERMGCPDDGVRFLPRGPKTPSEDKEYEGLLLVAGSEQRGHLNYLFPCSTIFQFFWARTSKWAQLMVDGRFVDYNRYIFDARNSYLSGDRREALVWLRQWMRDADAPFIATLAFDEYALNAGADIYRHLAQAPREVERRSLRALPPYQGCMSLRVLQHTVMTRSGPAMLVQCISSCDYKSTIEKLRFDRDNDGRPLAEVASGEAGEKLPMDRPSFGGPLVTLLESSITLENGPHATQKGTVDIQLAHLTECFPGLQFIETTKLPQTETIYTNQAQALIRQKNWEKAVSTLEDAMTSGELAPHALIRGEEHLDETENDDATLVNGDIVELARRLLSGEHFSIQGDEATWTAAPSLVIMPGQYGYFFPVRRRVAGTALAWLYRDKDKSLRKRALCIRVTFTHPRSKKTITRYLLDFEPRQTSGTSRQTKVLFFWNFENTPIYGEVDYVLKLINAIAKKGQTSIAKSDMLGLEGHPRNHLSRITHENAQRFLQSMFDAVDTML
ncbi:hypothetical protein [Melaminivora sp.]|uniref:hypothetical protein n=1 Tax=Melaminivora sp. TaxID=1933032 RepID=UPI0028A68BFE|nr:hypothetical protein [Melaminivora sp.]